MFNCSLDCDNYSKQCSSSVTYINSICFRHQRIEREIQEMSWKIKYDDIKFMKRANKNMVT